MERLKGIPLKLRAVDEFLSENPQYCNKLLFVIIGISAAEREDDYYQTQAAVHQLVDNLNTKYAESIENPVAYFQEFNEKDVNLARRLAFWGASNILMCTATRFAIILDDNNQFCCSSVIIIDMS